MRTFICARTSSDVGLCSSYLTFDSRKVIVSERFLPRYSRVVVARWTRAWIFDYVVELSQIEIVILTFTGRVRITFDLLHHRFLATRTRSRCTGRLRRWLYLVVTDDRLSRAVLHRINGILRVQVVVVRSRSLAGCSCLGTIARAV